jgi:hypothetical protein
MEDTSRYIQSSLAGHDGILSVAVQIAIKLISLERPLSPCFVVTDVTSIPREQVI